MKKIDYSEVRRRFSGHYCKELAMFGALSQDSLAYLFEQGRVLEYEKGDMLFQTNDQSDRFYIVLEGSVGYYRQGEDEMVHIRNYNCGEQIGFVGMIGLHERRGDVVAEENTTVLEISNSLFHQVCDNFASDFVIFLINMTREMSREITDLDSICANLRAKVR